MPLIQSKTQVAPANPPKDPIIALVLSLILLGGAGQIYLGQTTKGIVLIVATARQQKDRQQSQSHCQRPDKPLE